MSNPADGTRTACEVELAYSHIRQKSYGERSPKRHCLAQWLMNNNFRAGCSGGSSSSAPILSPNWNGIIDCEVLIVESR